MPAPPPRRITLLDLMILVATAAVSVWLLMTYRNATPAELGWRHGRDFGFWLGAAYQVLLVANLGTLALRFVPPRPPLRRLARWPGFLAGFAVSFTVACSLVNLLFICFIIRRQLLT